MGIASGSPSDSPDGNIWRRGQIGFQGHNIVYNAPILCLLSIDNSRHHMSTEEAIYFGGRDIRVFGSDLFKSGPFCI